MRRCTLIVLTVLLSCAAVAGIARADGDPASDVLAYENVYLPFETPSPTASAALARQVSSVYTAGYRIKVAVIATKTDLGSIPSLFDKPTNYAAFLGQELSTVYIGPLLIVMPAGYGLYDGGRSVAAEQAVIAKLPRPSSARADDLVGAATTAVASMVRAGALTSKDILKPYVTVLTGSSAPGRLTIRYYVYDDSGHATVAVTVTRAGHVLFNGSIRSTPASFSKVLKQTFPLSSGVSFVGARVCLSATDATGNRSARSCHKIAG